MRDYAKQNSHSKQPSESDGTGILVFLVICTLLFAGYVTYHFTHNSALTKNANPAFVKTSPHDKAIKKRTEHEIASNKIIEPKNPKTNVTKKPVQKIASINPADSQPTYDFYKMLPEMTVPIPKNDEPMLPKAVASPLNNKSKPGAIRAALSNDET